MRYIEIEENYLNTYFYSKRKFYPKSNSYYYADIYFKRRISVSLNKDIDYTNISIINYKKINLIKELYHMLEIRH